ncbi:PREDICTED: interferon lambda-1-like [Dipodomys ordii]|uniref:Interferon lambda-1-like n=1 Tax=Dipodomys ordii TaxID=10020 RepID=A0A1S3GS87_DIPOR|nr:PREDICTED: interferon lambda-1-like [Dipodomys ordii]
MDGVEITGKGAEMPRRSGATLALVLCALAAAAAAAGLAVEPGRCVLSQYRSLAPRALAAVRALRDGYVSDTEPEPRVPSPAFHVSASTLVSGTFPEGRFPASRRGAGTSGQEVWERPEALHTELDLTLKVLGSVADPALGDILDQWLSILYYIHYQLLACVSPGPKLSQIERPRLSPQLVPGPTARLSHWLHRLQAALKQASGGP